MNSLGSMDGDALGGLSQGQRSAREDHEGKSGKEKSGWDHRRPPPGLPAALTGSIPSSERQSRRGGRGVEGG